jgi:hypothetical protein
MVFKNVLNDFAPHFRINSVFIFSYLLFFFKPYNFSTTFSNIEDISLATLFNFSFFTACIDTIGFIAATAITLSPISCTVTLQGNIVPILPSASNTLWATQDYRLQEFCTS